MKLVWFNFNILKYVFTSLFIMLLGNGCQDSGESIRPISSEVRENYPNRVITVSESHAKTRAAEFREEIAVEVHEGLVFSLWASDSLIADPVAISIDPSGGIYYNRAIRHKGEEFDIRDHPDWMTPSISWQTVEDRRAFIREAFAAQNEKSERFLQDLNKDGVKDWKDLAIRKEQVWYVEDTNQDGFADRTQLYLEDFHEEITDIANGIEYHNGEVFISVGPDLWRTKDDNGDGIADLKESISRGYAVHVGFGAHGMSGAIMGPDGRLWWGIGDIGMNVVDQDGKRWKYPNQGVIVRSEIDGSGFEVYSAGLRNTHEFTFDKYGNLISVDNDGDHRGERERLVYLINGSDGGWRINWQFGKYTDADNNGYKVWMDEKLHIPRWEGQAAYILPPIVNYVNGPTGLVYNPGTAFSQQWEDHFFVAEFRGTPALSPLHAFTLKPKGASFELDKTEIILKGVLPTGLDFGPDGALYFGDWITGWGLKERGRIWKLDTPEASRHPLRPETQQYLAADASAMSIFDLSELLSHYDMRIRQKAQFELVNRKGDGLVVFQNTARERANQLSRIHALWGIAQMARLQDMAYAEHLTEFLKDDDDEIITQAAKMLGDLRYEKAAPMLVPLLENPSLRIQLHATEALGRMAHQDAFDPILAMLEKNKGEDSWLRHASMIALGRIGNEAKLAALADHESGTLRIAAVVALRRMSSPAVAGFLADEDEYIVTEAARAINDDFSIEAALPDLARVLSESRFTSEPLLRRAISANLRVGQPENIELLVEFAADPARVPEMRAEALAALGTWRKPSVHDRVDGRYRGVITREAAPVIAVLEPRAEALLNDPESAVQIAALRAAGKLGLSGMESSIFTIFESGASDDIRIEALHALQGMQSPKLEDALALACDGRSPALRSAALEIIPESNLPEAEAVALFARILDVGGTLEQQKALGALGAFNSDEAVKLLGKSLDRFIKGTANSGIRLDIIDAVEQQKNPELMEKLENYFTEKEKADPLASFAEALSGGDAREGDKLFYNHAAAQCVRCHTIFEHGGDAGPGLADVGSRLSKKQLLTALVDPSAELASGYGIVSIKLKNGETISGILLDEGREALRVDVGQGTVKSIELSAITSRTNSPSSMPPMGTILTKREIRDLIAFLETLKDD